MHFLNLIRYKNLILIILLFIVFKYTYLDIIGVYQVLTDFQYILLILSVVCIAAGGYIINDIYDVDADKINKPQKVVVGDFISEENCYNWYFIFTISGVVLGFYLSRVIQNSSFATIFIIVSALLYVYSNGIKQIPILGNLIISLVSAMPVMLIYLFNVVPGFPAIDPLILQSILFITIFYAIFSFLLTLGREIVKTLEDKEGDQQYGISTVATNFGNFTAKTIAAIPLILVVITFVYFSIERLQNLTFSLLFVLAFLIAPSILSVIKLFQAKTKEDYTFISNLLKIIILLTILSLPIITWNVYYAAGNS